MTNIYKRQLFWKTPSDWNKNSKKHKSAKATCSFSQILWTDALNFKDLQLASWSGKHPPQPRKGALRAMSRASGEEKHLVLYIPRWLFGISEPSTGCFSLWRIWGFGEQNKTLWPSLSVLFLRWGGEWWLVYLEGKDRKILEGRSNQNLISTSESSKTLSASKNGWMFQQNHHPTLWVFYWVIWFNPKKGA